MEKTLGFHDVIILSKSVINENQNNYYYNVFLERGCYKESNTQYF